MLTRRAFSIALTAAAPAATGRLRVGCQMNAYKDPADLAELEGLIVRIRDAGYAGFETNVRNVRWDVEACRAAIRRGGIAFIGPHTNMNLGLAGLREAAARTAALGGERIVVSGAQAELDDAKLKDKAAFLNEAGEYCRRRHLVLIYHNHKWEFDSGAAEMEGLIRHTRPEFVSFLMDVGHAHLAGVDPARFLRRHPGRIDSIHLRAVDQAGGRLPLGEGAPSLDTLAEEIRKLNWTGWLINEPELRTADTAAADAWIRGGREAIRKAFSI